MVDYVNMWPCNELETCAVGEDLAEPRDPEHRKNWLLEMDGIMDGWMFVVYWMYVV